MRGAAYPCNPNGNFAHSGHFDHQKAPNLRLSFQFVDNLTNPPAKNISKNAPVASPNPTQWPFPRDRRKVRDDLRRIFFLERQEESKIKRERGKKKKKKRTKRTKRALPWLRDGRIDRKSSAAQNPTTEEYRPSRIMQQQILRVLNQSDC